jgi:ABC-type phosphate transport system substrate-binding protein
MRNLKSMLMGSVAAIACVSGVSQPAHANYAFGDGSTAAAIVYRQMLDCLFNQAQGTPGLGGSAGGPLALAAACPGAHSGIGNSFYEILYAPTGSGNGKLTITGSATVTPNSLSTVGTPSTSIPYTDTSSGINSVSQYDGIQFAGSDDPLNSTDIANYSAAGGPAKFGNVYQLPTIIIPIAVGYKGTDGTGANLSVGSGGLKLSRQALCGIVSGHVTQWNNSILTTLNGGVTLGTGNITFIHRQDGSGTTFLLTNALATQCYDVTGPQNESNATVVSYALPWTDHTASCPIAPVGVGTDTANWPDLTTDQCSNAIANPGGGHYSQASGSGALVALVGSTNGAIGYASADYWAPIKSGGMAVANIQNQWSVTHNALSFVAPTAANAQSTMSEINPNFPGTSITDPLAWSLQGVYPNPVQSNSYPISGFTWVVFYQCYQSHSNGNNALNAFEIFLNYDFGATVGTNIINANGFATVPFPWLQQSYNLLNGSSGPQITGSGSCPTQVGAY